MELIITTPIELRNQIKEAITELDKEKEKNNPAKLYSVAELARKLEKSYNSIRKYIDEGLIRTAANGQIPEDAVNEFLNRKEADMSP